MDTRNPWIVISHPPSNQTHTYWITASATTFPSLHNQYQLRWSSLRASWDHFHKMLRSYSWAAAQNVRLCTYYSLGSGGGAPSQVVTELERANEIIRFRWRCARLAGDTRSGPSPSGLLYVLISTWSWPAGVLFYFWLDATWHVGRRLRLLKKIELLIKWWSCPRSRQLTINDLHPHGGWSSEIFRLQIFFLGWGQVFRLFSTASDRAEIATHRLARRSTARSSSAIQADPNLKWVSNTIQDIFWVSGEV
jgi:hypothetical protein